MYFEFYLAPSVSSFLLMDFYCTVQKPREQVADAEALLDIANTLLTAFRSQANEGITPTDFLTALLRNFGMKNGTGYVYDGLNVVSWADIGFAVSRIFRMAPGCSTM